jgi:hypothetical protein
MSGGVAVTYGAAVTDWIKSTSEASADIVAAARRELARQ